MDVPEALVPDRQLRIAEMFVATFRYLRRNPGATLGIGALLSTATSVIGGIAWNTVLHMNGSNSALSQVLGGETLTVAEANLLTRELYEAAPLLAIVLSTAILAQFAAMGVMTLGIVQALRGIRVQPATLWRAVPWKRIFGANLAVVALMLAAAAIPLAFATVMRDTWGLLALAIAISASSIVGVMTALAVPAIVMDDYPVRAAIARSMTITRGALVRTGWALLASAIVWQSVGSIIANPIASILGLLAGGPSTTTGSVLTSLLSGIGAGAIALPAVSGMTTLIYLDRVRRSSNQ